MHARYQRRFQHAEAALIQKRQADPIVIGSLTLTGPLTITIVSTSSPSSSRVTATTSTSQISSSTTIPTPSLSSRPSSSIPPPTSTPTLTPTPSNTTREGSNGFSSSPISSGAIAGIVIGVLILLCLGLFFTLRHHVSRSRVQLRKAWTRSKAISVPALFTGSSFEPKPFSASTIPLYVNANSSNIPTQYGERSPGTQFASNQFTSMNPPPATYNNEMIATTATKPVYSPPSSNLLSPFSAVVVCTFVVALPDELAVKVGELVRVLAEYDDGWALCMNANGEQGMVPLECFNRDDRAGAASSSQTQPVDADARSVSRGSRRVSSLDPTAQALKAYRTA